MKPLITFDFWDTLFLDDSDEPKRKAAGLPSKHDARRHLVHTYLENNLASSSFTFSAVEAAYNQADAEFRVQWKEKWTTWTVATRLGRVFDHLGVKPEGSSWDELVLAHEQMEYQVPPDILPGVDIMLKELSATFTLGIISDTIFSPGRTLKLLLKDNGLLSFFKVFVFSDERSYCKPDPRVFQDAAKEAGVPIQALIHIGDREHNDVLGPLKVGARAILTTVAQTPLTLNSLKDHGTKAQAVCHHYRELPKILKELNP